MFRDPGPAEAAEAVHNPVDLVREALIWSLSPVYLSVAWVAWQVSKGAAVAGVAITGVVVGAFTAGIGLVPYLAGEWDIPINGDSVGECDLPILGR